MELRMTSEFIVRPYKDEDQSALIQLWETCFPDDPPWNNPADVIRRKLTVQPELLIVCLAHGRVVGSVLAGFDGFRGWVNKVATHPEYQRKGIASLLMKTAEEKLAAMGCTKLNLQIRAENASVVAFYEGVGYKIEDRVSMGKRLL
jgi:ribosomal protein S18 acetylase RimI-like enzyme